MKKFIRQVGENKYKFGRTLEPYEAITIGVILIVLIILILL
jgi:hypothetical protein